MDIRVEIVREASEELVDAFGRLLPQLSSTGRREAAASPGFSPGRP